MTYKDAGWWTEDAKWLQKNTWSLAKWAKTLSKHSVKSINGNADSKCDLNTKLSGLDTS